MATRNRNTGINRLTVTRSGNVRVGAARIGRIQKQPGGWLVYLGNDKTPMCRTSNRRFAIDLVFWFLRREAA